MSEEVTEPPAEQKKAPERDEVRVHDPREGLLREAEIRADGRERHADDRHVQDDHQIPEAEDQEREPAPIHHRASALAERVVPADGSRPHHSPHASPFGQSWRPSQAPHEHGASLVSGAPSGVARPHPSQGDANQTRDRAREGHQSPGALVGGGRAPDCVPRTTISAEMPSAAPIWRKQFAMAPPVA